MRRTAALIAAIIIVVLLITGIVIAIVHGVSSDKKPVTAGSDSSQTSNVPSTDNGNGTPDATSDSNSSASNQQTSNGASSNSATGSSSTIPSTGPSDTIVTVMTAAALGSAAYFGTRIAVAVRVRK